MSNPLLCRGFSYDANASRRPRTTPMAAEVAPDDLAAQRNGQGLLGFFSLDRQHPVGGTVDHEDHRRTSMTSGTSSGARHGVKNPVAV